MKETDDKDKQIIEHLEHILKDKPETVAVFEVHDDCLTCPCADCTCHD